MKKPTVLMIMDGWGVNRPYAGNAVHYANTPVFDGLLKKYKHAVLKASEEAVGLPGGVFGNSEVGHITLGAGRVLYQDLLRINREIESGEFNNNPALLKAISHAKQNNSTLHLMGLVSDGCVHSSDKHLFALIDLFVKENFSNFVIHAFLDGRDTARDSGLSYIAKLEEKLAQVGYGRIATISGRFWAMDRDNNWNRVARAYCALTKGEGVQAESATEAIKSSYAAEVYDEELIPTVIKGGAPIKENDAVIFFNYRSDRAREITKAFVDVNLDEPELNREKVVNNLCFVTFTQYQSGLPVEVAYSPEHPHNTLGEILSQKGLKQLRIAETEKYAHVTYFFNGGREEVFTGEERILVPSPKVASYAEQPEMSALEVTEKLLAAIASDKFDFILVNYANADMVGHTGDIEAAKKAVETVDSCLGQLVEAVSAKGGQMLITADHGNADEMLNEITGAIIKEHTMNLVPLIFVGADFEMDNSQVVDLHEQETVGGLADIAPTILKMMDLEKPVEMTGKNLV